MTGRELYQERRKALPRLRAWLAAHPETPLWRVAEQMGYAEATLLRYLRRYAPVTERMADNILTFLDGDRPGPAPVPAVDPALERKREKARRRYAREKATKAADEIPRHARRCHTCGKPTNNYWCDACRKKRVSGDWEWEQEAGKLSHRLDGDWVYA